MDDIFYPIYRYIEGEPQFVSTKLLLDKVYGVSYRILLFLFVQYFLPMILLVWLNGHVIWTLRRSVAYRGGHDTGLNLPPTTMLPMKVARQDHLGVNTPSRSSSAPTSFAGSDRRATVAHATTMQKSTRNVTIMVSIVVLMCIICNVIAMTSQVCDKHIFRLPYYIDNGVRTLNRYRFGKFPA